MPSDMNNRIILNSIALVGGHSDLRFQVNLRFAVGDLNQLREIVRLDSYCLNPPYVWQVHLAILNERIFAIQTDFVRMGNTLYSDVHRLPRLDL